MDWRERPVGFFPFFANLAESSRLVRTAERFRELGGRAVFFSHGGEYEALARDAGFAVQPVAPIYTEEQIRDLMKFDQLEKLGDPFPDEWLIEHVLSEERAYACRGVSLVVTGFNVPCVLSARKARIPLVHSAGLHHSRHCPPPLLGEEELPSVAQNVLLKKFVPAESVNKMADIAVLHGGQGTFYTAAYSGRPVVGIPMQPEQQYNIDILVRSGSAIRLSKRHFREEDLLRAVEVILADYEAYRARAEKLARRLPPIDGALRGAERIRAIAIEHEGDPGLDFHAAGGDRALG